MELFSLTILNSAALLALFSLLVPIIIHIINPSRGKLIYIGKIDFIKVAQKLKVTELKLTEILLLIA